MFNFRKIHELFYIIILVLVFLVLNSCSAIRTETSAEDELSLTEMRMAVMADSTDLEALKEYAIALVKSKQHAMAQKYLSKAINKMPFDPALLFNLGLNFEFLNNNYNALQAYSNYPLVPENSLYNDLMKGRFLLLSREVAGSEIKDLLKREESIDLSSISEKNLAVFPLTYLGSDQKYLPLSTGFSEMISIDLGKVKDLTVLERIRLQAVMDELKFGKSALVDKTTAPRMGKLLSAGKLYKGTYNVSAEKDLYLEISSWDVIKNETGEVIKKEVSLSELFQIEKEIVFDILYQLGIDLTPQEREEIEYIPTQNMDAFLAYSRGLELELEGNFSQASSYFNNAVQLDPNFNNAVSKGSSTKSMSSSSGTKENVLSKSSKIEVSSSPNSNTVNQRFETLGSSIRAGFSNSIDNREPAQEEQISTKEIAPPPPRPRRP